MARVSPKKSAKEKAPAKLKVLIRHCGDPEAGPRSGAPDHGRFSRASASIWSAYSRGACFLADLAREISLETSFDFIAVSSYGRGKESSGQVRVLKDLDSSIAGLGVILVEDILDTGLTLNYLLRVFRRGGSRRVFAVAAPPG